MKKKILIIYNDVPTNNFGGNIRVLELIKNLSLHLDVTLLTLNSNKISLKEISKHCDVVIAKQNLFSKNLFFSLFHVIIRIYYFIIKRLFLWHPKITRVHWYQIYLLRKELSKLLNNNEYDLIQVEHSYLGNVLYKIKSKSMGTPVSSLRKKAAFWIWVSPHQLPFDRKNLINFTNMDLFCSSFIALPPY